MSEKIINLQERRALEQAVQGLANTENELQQAEAARQIVHQFPADALLPALLKHLETADSQLRGGLGHLAALLPQEEITGALRSVAGDKRRNPLARMTAVAIAQRFLGVEFPATLTHDLSDANDAAFQSLLDALQEAKRNRHVLLEYVEQMRGMGEEIAFLVMDALGRVPPGERVELLRLMAQDERPAVAKAALSVLETLGSSEAGLQVARAIHTLPFVLPGELATLAERSGRKLRMAGRRYDPPPAAGWRALLSPADPNGSQSVWLLHLPATGSGHGVLLGVTVNLGAGIVRFFCSEKVDKALMPAQRNVGELLSVENDAGAPSVVLEAPFAYGCWLVLGAIRTHLAADRPQPLPGELQLYNDHFTQFAAPQVDDALLHCWQSKPLASGPLNDEAMASATATLFAHPVMAHWVMPARAILQATPATARPDPGLPVDAVVQALLREINRWAESAALGPSLERALRAQAAWLQVAGQGELAAVALALALQMTTTPIPENPVLAHMLAAGLGATPG
jgi:hypothetical protein